MKYDKKLHGGKKKKPQRRVEPEHLAVPNFVQTPPSKRVANPQRRQKMQANSRRHRRRHKKNYILYYISLVALILIVGISLSLTVLFNIESITIEGNEGVSAEEIIASSGINKGQNLFRISTGKAREKIISTHITIDNIYVKRKLPDTLVIKVEMAKTKAELAYLSKSYSISHSNKIIGIGDKPLDKAAIRVVGSDMANVTLGQYIKESPENKLKVLDIILDEIAEQKISQIKVIDITDEMTIKLYYNDTYEIKIGGTADIKYKLEWAVNLIATQLTEENEKGIIDVSVNNGMYYFRHADKIDIP